MFGVSILKKSSIPETKSSPLEIDGWKMKNPFGFRPIFRGELLVFGRGKMGLGLCMKGL